MSHSHYLQKCQPLTNLLSRATLYIYLESLHGGDKCHSIGYIQGLTRLISRHMALHIATYLGTKATLAYLDTCPYNITHVSFLGTQVSIYLIASKIADMGILQPENHD